MDCIFSAPVLLNATGTESWQFSKLVCSNPIYEQITNASTGGTFYIQKTLSYGDALILWFVFIFSVFCIAKIIFSFFWRK